MKGGGPCLVLTTLHSSDGVYPWAALPEGSHVDNLTVSQPRVVEIEISQKTSYAASNINRGNRYVHVSTARLERTTYAEDSASLQGQLQPDFRAAGPNDKCAVQCLPCCQLKNQRVASSALFDPEVHMQANNKEMMCI